MRLCNRLAKHMEATPKTHSGRWIQVLKTQGKRPIIAYLDEAKHDWAERERFWIAHLRAIGCRLTNTSPGGDGAHAVAESTRKLLSAIHKGKPRPKWVRDKLSRSQKGRIKSPEHRAKLSAALKGRKLSPEHKAKSLAALKRRKEWIVTPEMRAKIGAANRGRKQTDEQRARNSASKKGIPKSPEHRAKLSEAALRWRAKK